MTKRSLTDDDIRETPAYSIGEAAEYLRLPKSTLRAWVLGQRYGKSKRFFKSVIAIADRGDRKLSFINLVEAFVLAGIRRERVVRDPAGVAQKIVLFAARTPRDKGSIVLDPRYSFGRPILDGYALRTAIVAERFQAGEKMCDLARDYGVPPDAIENAIRCERRAA